jgi:membrane protein YqaA with SNARE-associated domain
MANLPTILLESAWTASVIPFSHQPTFFALLAFGQPMTAPLIAAILGATLGQGLNYALGRALLNLREQGALHVPEPAYQRICRHFSLYGFLVLLCAWWNLFGLLTLLAGFFRVPLWKALPALVIGYAGYYGYFLLV